MHNPTRTKMPSGLRAPPRPSQKTIASMTVRELHDRHHLNAQLLSAPSGSSTSHIPRVAAEQAEIVARLTELEGVDNIREGMQNVTITEDQKMAIDSAPEPYPVTTTLSAKRRALAAFGSKFAGKSIVSPDFSLQEAIALEQEALQLDKERQQRALEKKQRQGLIGRDEQLNRQEMEERMWAFMNYKPSESDMEDEDDDSDSDGDPSTWFEDDQDDGRKGQDIVEPDMEDLTDIIRMDESKFHYNTFYEPHEEGD